MIIESLQVEKSLIAWICYNGKFVDVPEDYFWSVDNREIYKKFRAQFEATGEVEATLLSTTHFDIIAESERVAFPKNPEPIVTELARIYKINSAWVSSQVFIKCLQAGNVDDDVFEKHHGKLTDLMVKHNNKSEYNHEESFTQFAKDTQDAITADNSIIGIRSGLSSIDSALNGFQRGMTYVFGGLKKTGKSRFAIDIMSNFLEDGHGGIMFSMEMKPAQIHGCMVSSRTGINTAKYGTNKLTPADLDTFLKEGERYKKEPFYIDATSASNPEHIRAVIRKCKTRQDVTFCCVDYIQKMSVKAESRTKAIEYCATTLADIARDENVIMIILSQLSGEAEKMTSAKGGATAPIYSYIKESQAIIEACDAAIILADPNRGKNMGAEQSPAAAKILIAAILQRHGASDLFINLSAELAYSRFFSVDSIHGEEW